MKGISSIIVVILLVLIAVSIVGMAFTFFSGITSTATEAVQDETENQINRLSKQISIDAATNTTVSIRNTGTAVIPANEIQVYVAGAQQTCSPVLSDFNPEDVQTCDFGTECTSGQEISVTSSANSVQRDCP